MLIECFMLLVRLSVKRRLLVTNILGNRKLDVDFQLHKGSAFLTPELFNSQLYVINVVFKIEIFFSRWYKPLSKDTGKTNNSGYLSLTGKGGYSRN